MRTKTVVTLAGLVLAGLVGVGVAGIGHAGPAPSEDAAKQQSIAALEQRNQQQRLNAPRDAKPAAAQAQAQAARSSLCAAVGWEQGLSSDRSAPIPRGVIEVSNAWHQTIGSANVSVFVGASAQDPAQGLVVVQSYTLCGQHSADEDFAAPAGLGRLTIASVSGHTLTLTAGSGATVSFNVDTRAFGG